MDLLLRDLPEPHERLAAALAQDADPRVFHMAYGTLHAWDECLIRERRIRLGLPERSWSGTR